MASQLTVVLAKSSPNSCASSGLRKCTCAMENDSDSEEESGHLPGASGGSLGASVAASFAATAASSSSALVGSSSNSSSSTLPTYQTRLSMARSSPAWHHSEALKRTKCLANVFCACYDADTVLASIQKPPSDSFYGSPTGGSFNFGSGASGSSSTNKSPNKQLSSGEHLSTAMQLQSQFSPLQLVLLEATNVLQVFTTATSNCQVVWNKRTNTCEICQVDNNEVKPSDPCLSRQQPPQLPPHKDDVADESKPSCDKTGESTTKLTESRPKKPPSLVQKYRNGFLATEIILRFYLQVFEWRVVRSSEQKAPLQDKSQSTSNIHINAGLSGRSHHPRMPLPLPLTIPSNSGSALASQTQAKPDKQSQVDSFFSLPYSQQQHQVRVVLRPVPVVTVQPDVRDSSMRANSMDVSNEPHDPDDPSSSYPWKDIFLGLYQFLWQDQEVDSVLVTNMTRITKTLAVHQVPLFIMASVEHQQQSIFARMAVHAYNPELASLLHGLVHVAQRKKAHQVYRQIIHTMIDSILQPPLSFLTVAMHHARLSHLVQALCGMVCMEFPNTFRYSIHRVTQLASYETIPAFERLLFPLKTLPTDPSLHQDIQQEVLHLLCDYPIVFERLTSLGITQIIHLNMRYKTRGVPDFLLVDLVKCTIEKSLKYGHNIKELLPFLQKMASSLCLLINYRRHRARIEQFANCNRFSDSDSDSEVENECDSGNEVDLDANRHSDCHSPISRRDSARDPTKAEAFEEAGEADDARAALSEEEEDDSRDLLRNVDTLSPLGSTTLVIHVILVLRAIIAVGRDALDIVLARQQLCASLLALFDRFREASILHCALVQVLLQILNRTTSGRVNNPLLRSLFQPPASLLQFIMTKLNRTNKPRSLRFSYEVHLSILGVKIDRISSAPTLQQEIVRQFCLKITSWQPFCSSLVARHYQQMDALSDHAIMPAPSVPNNEKPSTPVPVKKAGSFRSLLGSSGAASPSSESSKQHSSSSRSRRGGIDDDPMEVLLKSLSESSSCAFLSSELQPFRRLPTGSEGIGSDQNLATGKEAVHPSDMYKSRSQSQFPKAILDILHAHQEEGDSDHSMRSPFETVETNSTVTSDVYQKNSEWIKVHLILDKASCQLSVETIETVTSGNTTTSALSKFNQRAQLILSLSSRHFNRHGSRDKPNRRFVVSNARPWIVFGRSIKNPDAGAFGFQVDVIDPTNEEDQTLTFVTRSEVDRSKWCQAMLKSVQESRTKLRRPSCAIDPAALVSLVKRVAFKYANNGSCELSVLPDADQMTPWIVGNSFYLESEVPEELPFFGIYHGLHGIHKYLALFHACLEIVHAKQISLQPSGFTVVLEFEMTVKTSQEYLESEANRSRNSSMDSYASPTTNPRRWPTKDPHKDPVFARVSSVPMVNCRCTDTYYIDSNQILGITRTIVKEDVKKLVDLLCSDEKEPNGPSSAAKGREPMTPKPSALSLSLETVEALMLDAPRTKEEDSPSQQQEMDKEESPVSDDKEEHERDHDVASALSKQLQQRTSMEVLESLSIPAEPVE